MNTLYFALVLVTVALFFTSFCKIFFVSPVEEQMGIVQKVFYFHVPSAYCMYVGYSVCAVCGAIYLVTRKDRFDAIAVAGAEVGLMFSCIVLTTGPLWARKAWGVYWTWDPRLTTTLLAALIFVAFLVLRSFGEAGEGEKRFAAGLAIVGLLDLPIIHYSVQRWRGQHPTVITGRGGVLSPDMKPALLFSFLAFTALVALLIWTRTRVELARMRVRGLEMDASEHGLMEDA